jgi:transposase
MLRCGQLFGGKMARYKHTDIGNGQGMFLTVNLKEQLLPGTFEHMLDDLIGNRIDISDFDINYKNDDTGSKAIPPAALIKLIIYGYSKGMKSSRKICELCKNNIIGKALSGGLEPHWTTIASFISSNSELFKGVFVKVLAYCVELNLVGGETFAIDGCRLPSNASMELSGTKEELEKKLEVCSKMAEKHVEKHKRQDERGELDKETEKHYIERQIKLKRQIEKLDSFLMSMDKKIGKSGEENKSNVTDNESAMIRAGSGYIQGYIGLAVSDDRNQVIVNADVVGSANEGESLPKLLDDTLSNMEEVKVKASEGKEVVAICDANYFSEDNLKACQERGIEAIIPDGQYRRRLAAKAKGEMLYEACDFKYHEEENYYECPNGKRLEYKRIKVLPRGHRGKEYEARAGDCRTCPHHGKCIKNKKDKSKMVKGRNLFITESNDVGSFAMEMREKLNTIEYQDQYSYRIQIIEPVFANIKYCKGLDRFTLRSKKKVSGQWNLYCIVHNLCKCLKGYNSNMGYA